MARPLLLSRRFLPLFLRQFLTAFNDNFIKNILILLILLRPQQADSAALVSLAGAIFIVPFFLFSALGGELADKYDKALVIRWLSIIEFGGASLAAIGLFYENTSILFIALFYFGVTAALFGPAKYGVLPDHLTQEELPSGNAYVESATFLAILSGAIAGGFAIQSSNRLAYAGALVIIWLCSVIAARFIPKTAAAAPTLKVDLNIFRSTYRLLKLLRANETLRRLTVITSMFWLFGAIAMALMPTVVTQQLHGSENIVTLHLTVFAIAIALGSCAAAFLLKGRIVLLPTVAGALLIATAAADLGCVLYFQQRSLIIPQQLDISSYFAQQGASHATIDFALFAFSGGLMIVPAFAAIQALSPLFERARMIAAVNVHNAAFMAIGGVIVAYLQNLGLSFTHLLWITALLAFCSAVWILKKLIENPFSDFLSIFFRAFYRLEVRGLENFQKAGRNPIIALNHISFLDAAAILSILPMKPVFAIDYAISQKWWVKPFLRFAHVMPLDPTKPFAIRTLVAAVKSGKALVIFPEGRLTVTGSLMKIYDGAGLIADKTAATIIPVRIEGPESTIFSRLTPQQARRRWFPKVTLTILEPTQLSIHNELKGRKRREAAGALLYQIMSDLVFRTSKVDETLFDAVVGASKKHGPSRTALEDPSAGALTYRALLTSVRLLAIKLTNYGRPREAIGVMLPNANAAGVTFFALLSAGRTPAMINFTSGATNILSGCKASEIKIILTSRHFINKAKLTKLVEALSQEITLVYLEDIKSQLTIMEKITAFLLAHQAVVPSAPEDIAAILFTSGSEGAPKGVALSHKNILVNAAQAAARIDFGRTDKVFNVLPVFHCFGLSIGLILPLISGVPVYLYPSPLHYRLVPELIYGANATILFGTDTFLAGYARMASAYDFRSIRYVVAGAEPLKKTTRDIWSEKFGVRIFEGYGVTETAPVLALNTPMFNKFGTVGQLMPGVDYRLEPMAGIDHGGRLLVRGPNVMLGYLKADLPGIIQPPPDGWHDTGDIVVIDEEGFVTIKGRAKRFAKIGGEMVSLAAIEQLAAELWPKALSAAATDSDNRKGERVILLSEEKNANRADFMIFAKEKGASDLMIPAEVMTIETMPLLGSGKIDFAAVAQLARARERGLPAKQLKANGSQGRIEGA